MYGVTRFLSHFPTQHFISRTLPGKPLFSTHFAIQPQVNPTWQKRHISVETAITCYVVYKVSLKAVSLYLNTKFEVRSEEKNSETIKRGNTAERMAVYQELSYKLDSIALKKLFEKKAPSVIEIEFCIDYAIKGAKEHQMELHKICKNIEDGVEIDFNGNEICKQFSEICSLVFNHLPMSVRYQHLERHLSKVIENNQFELIPTFSCYFEDREVFNKMMDGNFKQFIPQSNPISIRRNP